ncbi:MAG: selenite/tellurite reduction operon b-type cytochrome membrane protein ExtQ [Desulfuromonadaceae bacterium]|nr:selenite/tellurite reduction operon b-type cytochrome membrane protein ExtQ [Desulfuromonas sp.]MDY0213828.1 selenite/tellurite reduction operon b-type cytochrome membrane protein ExtQ [Desulfuromonadaceae bacterium]
MKEYVKSSPVFFTLIRNAMAGAILVVLVLAALFPAPLLEPADLADVPNPSRAAWFLIWTQEVVSYSKYAIYPIIFVGAVFAYLPWLPRTQPAERARWFAPEQRWINVLTLLVFAIIVILTVVALYFRGENWAFVPFA